MIIAGDSDSDAEMAIMGDSGDEGPVEALPVRVRRPTTRGPSVIVIICASLAGYFCALYPSDGFQVADNEAVLVGMAVVHWSYMSPDDAQASRDQTWFASARRLSSGVCKGFVAYEIEDVVECARVVVDLVNPAGVLPQIHAASAERLTVEQQISTWRNTHNKILDVEALALGPGLALRVVGGLTQFAHIVSLTCRVARDYLIGNLPSSYQCGRLVRFFGPAIAVPVARVREP